MAFASKFPTECIKMVGKSDYFAWNPDVQIPIEVEKLQIESQGMEQEHIWQHI
jgi:hypothetical protein